MRGYGKTMVVSLADITKFLLGKIAVRTYCPRMRTGWLDQRNRRKETERACYHSLKITKTAPPIMLKPRR
jgi:hypothetical protein